MEFSIYKISPLLTGALGRELEIYPEIGSTNDAARLLAKSGAPHGATVLARQQLAGKGRLGRRFFSPPDAGLYLSVILRLPLGARELLLLTPALAVAGARAIAETCGVSVRIKWVNDLYLHGKKVSGILCESALGEGGRVDAVVAGIGINVSDGSFPPELCEKATSLSAECREEIDRNRLAAAVLNHLDRLCGQLETREFLEEYRSRSCVLGKRVTILGQGEPREALALAIDEDARLVVELPDGERLCLSTGEISLKGDWA